MDDHRRGIIRTRRRFLAASSTALTLGIAGCSESNEGGTATTTTVPTETPTETTSETETKTETTIDPLSVKGSWPMVRYGPSQTGYAPDEDGPVTGVRQRWRVESRGGWRFGESSPVISGRTVFIQTSGYRRPHRSTESSRTAKLHAVGTATGAEQWVFDLESRTAGPSPAAVGDRIYLLRDSFSGDLYSLQADDGEFVWRADTHGASTSPVVATETAYLAGSGSSTDGDADETDAYATADGTRNWRFDPWYSPGPEPDFEDKSHESTGKGHRSVFAVSDGTVFLYSNNVTPNDREVTGLWALNTEDGRVRWSRGLYGAIQGQLAVSGGSIYLFYSPEDEDGYNLVALSTTDGREQWRTGLDMAPMSLSVDGKAVFVAQGPSNVSPNYGPPITWKVTSIVAYDAANGSRRWTRTLSHESLTNIVVTEEALYFGGRIKAGNDQKNGYVTALSSNDGTPLWTFKTEDEVRAHPVVADGALIVADGPYLYALSE